MATRLTVWRVKSPKRLIFVVLYYSLMPRPHPQKGGKGLAHFEPFLVFADSTVQDPGLIRLQACDLQITVRTCIS